MSKDIKKMLEDKLQQNNQRHSLATQSAEFVNGREYNLIPVDKIDPNPYQPRRIFPQVELENLAVSITEIGLLEPILLRRVNDRFQIAAGERRWRAHKLLNRKSIESIITDISDSDMAVFALAENVDREDLSDYEIGLAIRQIENLFPTKKKLAEALGLNREDMYRYFSFDELPEFIRNDLNINPRLLSRSAASDIKRILKQNENSEFINTCLTEAWSLIVASELDQTKAGSYIAKRLKELEKNETECHIQSTHNLIRNGKKVGNIVWQGTYLTVKLNTDIINQEKELQLKGFLESLIEADAVKV